MSVPLLVAARATPTPRARCLVTSPLSCHRLAAALLLAWTVGCARAAQPPGGRDAQVPDVSDVPVPDGFVTLGLRPIAPLSTATVTSRRPTLSWGLPSGADGAHVDLCRDRACTTVIASFDALGSRGAPAEDLPTGVVFWRLRARAAGATSDEVSAVWQFTVGARSAPVDTSWGTTLDVNGDGYADVAVGENDTSGSDGRVYVYQGGPAGLARAPATTLEIPDGYGDLVDFQVAAAGDVNGDGYADLVVGAGAANNGSGRAYVYLGGASGLAAAPARTLRENILPGGFYGASVAGVGDVNGDGYADVVVCAPNANPGQASGYLYLGSAAGLTLTAEALLSPPDSRNLGMVASAGDVNGDGLGDVAIGSVEAPDGTSRLHIYPGSPIGLAPFPAQTLPEARLVHQYFGPTVSAGDVNGDGYADVLAGTFDPHDGRGHARLYLGGATGLAASPALALAGPEGGYAGFGWTVLATADVNGDGYADGLIGANGLFGGDPRVYLYLGGASGLPASPSALIAPPAETAPRFGSTMSAGDLDGDGHYADVVIGGGGTADPATRAFVYFGGASGLAVAPTPIVAPQGSSPGFGVSVARASAARRDRKERGGGNPPRGRAPAACRGVPRGSAVRAIRTRRGAWRAAR